ncbi:YbaB/EbfC family nucleoid-associated protein [Saccharothrix australiensis]|nr:YbaB/EbfC family nucleoid-associated protein [Saccharothrix australiensis]
MRGATVSVNDEQLERVLARYREQRDELEAFQRGMSAISCTATAPRQTVKVTVGNQGELTDLAFPTDAYKRMAPAELAGAILTATREARGKALDAAAELLAPLLPAGLNARDIVEGKADLASYVPGEPPAHDFG